MAYVGGDAPSQSSCFLCDAINSADDDTNLVVERAGRTVTLLNRYPYSSGHVMVVPSRHASDLRDLDADEGAAVIQASQRAIDALERAMHPEGYNVGFNLGGVAGASTDHIHQHVVPRWAGDTNFMPVIGDIKVLPEHLEATAASLRQAYRELASAPRGERTV